MKQILRSVIGKSTANEQSYPCMAKGRGSGVVVLFTSRHEGVVLYPGRGSDHIGERVTSYSRAGGCFERYDGPVTITGEDVN